MKKRIVAAVIGALALVAFGGGGAQAVGETTSSTWFCVGVGHINMGVCQGNPLQDVPDLPRLPL